VPLDAVAQVATKRVLILTSYDISRPAVNTVIQSVTTTIRNGSNTRVEFFYEFQDNPRIPNSKYEEEMVRFLRTKYEGEEIAVVLALGGPALKFLLAHESVLFSNVPKVYYFHDETEITAHGLWPRVTGVWANLEVNKTLDMALTFQPDTQKVFVVSGNSEQDKFLREEAQKAVRAYQNRLQFTNLTDLTIEELKQKAATLPPHSVVLYLSFFADKKGDNFSGPEALSLFAPTANAPIYGISDTYMGAGIVGGSLFDFQALGRRTGEVALRIMAGETPQGITPQTAANLTMVDWRELRRWQFDETRLPAGSIVRFRELSFWQRYKWYVVAVALAFLVQAALIAWLLFTRRRRRQAESEQKRLAVLAETEHRRLNAVVSNVPGVVWEARIDPDTGVRKLTFISEYVEKMLGYSVEQCLATPYFWQSIVFEEDQERVRREWEAVVSRKDDRLVQFRSLTKDRRVVWVELHLSPIRDQDGNFIGLRGVTLDVTQKKQAEQAKGETEERNRAILRAIPDQMFLQTRDGVYLDYHAKNRDDLIAAPEEFLGRNMRDILPPQLVEDLFQCFERAEMGEPQVIEYALPFNGDERWYEASIVLSGGNILSVVRDVTARKTIENALRQNEAELAGIIGSAMDGIITVDENQRIVLFNAAAEKLFLCSASDALGHTLDRFIPERFREAHRQHVLEFGEKNITRRAMGLLEGGLFGLRTSGEEFPIEASISQIDVQGKKFYTVILRDITERMRSQQALRESEARFRNMADTAPVMIWVADESKGCTYFNKQWLDFTGRSLEQELGDGWAKGVHPDDYAHCMEVFASSFDKRVRFEMEYRLRNKDGQYHWIYDSGTPRFSSDGGFLGYIGSCIDITQRKESEQQLRKAHEELKELKNQLEAENIYLQEELQLDHRFDEIVGQSDAIKYVLFTISQVAPTDATVLIMGETGTGKELVARAIHSASSRKDRPLIKVNCGALAPSLIESELFGHEKGAFTGAGARKLGRFELANGGTIFLDEIGELPLELQVKLLRVIQENEFERLGGSKTIKTDVRIIAATNRNLKLEVDKGNFREDLWYRLNVFPITVPPLRQRKEDIPLLVEHFANKYAKKFAKTITSISPRAIQSLQAHSWPGNIRELANVIERAVIHAKGSVLQVVDRFEEAADETSVSIKTLEEVEREHIIRALENAGWRIEGPYGAAKHLDINPSTLRARMLKLGIQRRRASHP
jgi:PAS domain S-box-containing protein